MPTERLPGIVLDVDTSLESTPVKPPTVNPDTLSQTTRRISRELNSTGRPARCAAETILDLHQIELYRSEEISPMVIDEVSDTFRYTFNNSFPEFALCRDCQTQASAVELFSTDGNYIPLDALDGIEKMPDCPCCHNPMELFHDPAYTRQKLANRLGQNANLAVLRNTGSGKIDGFSFGYARSLEEVFRSEWQYTYSYCAHRDERYTRDYDLFIEKVMATFGQQGRKVTPNDIVYCWNCVAINNKEVQGKKILPALLQNFCRDLDANMVETLPVIGETMYNSRFYHILKRAGLERIDGVLEASGKEHKTEELGVINGNPADGDLVLMAGSLNNLVRRFSLPPDKF